MIPGVSTGNFFNKRPVRQTQETSSGARPVLKNISKRWEGLLDAGPSKYGTNPYGGDPNASLQQQAEMLNKMQSQYGAPGGYFDQAAQGYQNLAKFDPGQMKAGSFLQGPDMAQYMDRMGYNPEQQLALAEKRATRLGNLANIKNTAGAQRVNASGPGATRPIALGEEMAANIGLGLEQELANRDRQARMDATQAMQTDVNRLIEADKFNIGNKYATAGIQSGAYGNLMGTINPRMSLASRFGDQGRYADSKDIQAKQFDYQDFLRRENFTPNMLNQWSQMASSPNWGSTSTVHGEGKSPFEQALGLSMAGLGIYGMGGGSAKGNVWGIT